MARKAQTDPARQWASARRTPAGQVEPRPTDHQRSAGGVVVSAEQVLLISTQNGQRWQLPKGHLEAGETAEQAAVREVREETGVTGRVIAPLPKVEYWYVGKDGIRVHKEVDFFLLEYLGGDPTEFDPHEVSGAEWFSWEDGLGRMSFPSERRVAEQARNAAVELRSSGAPAPGRARSSST